MSTRTSTYRRELTPGITLEAQVTEFREGAAPARIFPPLRGPRCRYVFPSTGVLCMAPLSICSHPQPGDR